MNVKIMYSNVLWYKQSLTLRLLPENYFLLICNTETKMSENHFSPCELVLHTKQPQT
jgi:hypothetical protein